MAYDKSFSRPPCNVCQVVIHVFNCVIQQVKRKVDSGYLRVIEFMVLALVDFRRKIDSHGLYKPSRWIVH